MNNLPDHVLEEMREQLRRPRGTVAFDYTSQQLFDPDTGFGILFQIVAGRHLFRIERDENLKIKFFHSSPGTGTRVAEIDLNNVKPANTVFMAFTWQPSGITFDLGPRIEGGKLVQVSGTLSERQFRIGADNSVYQIGDHSVSVLGARTFVGGKPIITPTAMDIWKEVVETTKVLLQGKSDDGYIFEVSICNTILIVLVTGFERYCTQRFIELEQEGVIPNVTSMISSFFSRYQQDKGYVDALIKDAKGQKLTFVEYSVGERSIINFQNYDSSKKAFNKAYGIRFGEIGVSSQDLEQFQRIIQYRHSIVHVSPMLAILNQSEIPSEEPVFSSLEFAEQSLALFSKFIEALHSATLSLDRMDQELASTHTRKNYLHRAILAIIPQKLRRKFFRDN